MPKIHLRPSFNKAYAKFTKHDQKRIQTIDKTLLLFEKNPKHQSLHIEKLSGSNIWTIRIDRGNRLFFVWSSQGDIAVFFFVGPHDSYRTIK